MNSNFRTVRKGQYDGFFGRFEVQRIGSPALPWHAVQITRSEQGENIRVTVGTYRTRDEAMSACARIVDRERSERQAAQAAERQAAKEAREAALAAERAERQAANPSLLNTGIYAIVEVTHDEALNLAKRLIDYAVGHDSVQIWLRSEGPRYGEKDQRLVISAGSHSFDNARATIVDSQIESLNQTEEVSS